MNDQKVKTAAIVTIYNAPEMSKQGRRTIANWLRARAGLLETHNKKLARRWISRWQYTEVEKT